MSKKTNNRFDIIHEEVSWYNHTKIIVDKHTGVHYLYSGGANGGGITPLLNKEGKVIIDLGGVEVE